MSIPFTQLSTEDRNIAGYFRIGHVVLRTPPTDILTNRVSGKERITTLRGANDLIKLTGRGRWDVTVRWTAMKDDTATSMVDSYAQWEDLRSIVAIFKAAPFVEVENQYVRQVLSESDSVIGTGGRMAFGLRQLRITTHADIVDAFDCSLTMTLFNYFPYSSSFGYNGPDGMPVGADQSALFSSYIDTWKNSNLDSITDINPDIPVNDWMSQTPGTVTFTWREYTTLKYDKAVIQTPTGSTAATTAISSGTSATTQNPDDLSGVSSTKYDSLITKYAQQDGISAAMIKAVMWQESKGNPNAVQPNLRKNGNNYKNTTAGNDPNSVTAYLKQHITTDTDGGLATVTQYIRENGTGPDLGLMQLHYPGTAQTYVPGARPVDMLNPETSIMAGSAYLKALYSQGMTDDQISAYNTGRVGKIDTLNPNYSSSVLGFRDQFQAMRSSSGQPNLQAAAAAAPSSTTNVNQPASQTSSLDEKEAQAEIMLNMSSDTQKQFLSMLSNGWAVDFASNDLVYLYRIQNLTFADREHNEVSSPNTFGTGPIEMSPQQISILMINNLAQIPLASYMYPTYQHIGSPSSQIAIGFLSVGDYAGQGTEPIHTGVSQLGGIIAFLENQYLKYRNNWRSVASVHRMQAVYVHNQVLNMLGIRGLMLDNLSTENVPASSDTMQVELAATQYENVFETLTPFKINTISETAANVTQQLINSGSLGNLAPSEQAVIPILTQFATGRWAGDKDILAGFLRELGTQGSDIFGGFKNTTAISPTAGQITDLTNLVNQSPSNPLNTQGSKLEAELAGTGVGGGPGTAPAVAATVIPVVTYNVQTYPAFTARLTDTYASQQWTTGDAMIAYAMATDPSEPQSSATATGVKQVVTDVNALVGGNKAAIQSVYDAIFTLLASTNIAFAQNVNTMADSPAFSQQYNAAFNAAGPAMSGSNNGDHASYLAMGLRPLLTTDGLDNNPASYFYNDSAVRTTEFRSQIEQAVNASQDASNNKAAGGINVSSYGAEYDVTITDTNYVGANADTNSLIQMTNLPGMTMAEAFPTFKLFLMEDEAGSVINCFDNFYSYASVTEMEIAKYKDQPDVAVIQITNVANLFAHHLFDDTLMGRYQLSLEPGLRLTPGGPQGTGIGNTADIEGRNFAGQIYADGIIDGKRGRIPLQYIALQPGSKIQIRMGFSNNPDFLTPVFTGRITNINTENDMMVITAESYLGELCTTPIMSNGKPLNDKDFGSEWFNNDAGDTLSVVEWLLTTQSAKHFGGFRLSTAADNLVTGFTWENRLGRAISGWSVDPKNFLTYIGPALSSSYDRSGENVLINHITNYQGTPSQIRATGNDQKGRAYQDSATNTIMNLSFDYHVPKNSNFTTWDLIRDVTRRYPEFNVICKQYGFPYSADATMVVAHPLDWYFARPPMIGDVETYRTSPQLKPEWNNWWNVRGKDLWNAMLDRIGPINEMAITTTKTPTDPVSMDFELVKINRRTQTLSGMGESTPDPGTIATLLYGADVLAEKIVNEGFTMADMAAGLGNWSATHASNVNTIKAETVRVWNDWMSYVQQQSGTTGNVMVANDRLKPVRRYHFIDYNSIIHNGMVVNDKIYNAVRVGEDTIYANGNVPPAYRRVLDVTNLTVYPEKNLKKSDAIRRAIGQSFLRDEVGKMYRGEIVLRGIPEIEPLDCLVLLDPSTAITGIVEVEKVIHSFTLETGYITIVYPRCVIAINESASAGVMRMLSMVLAKTFSRTANGLGVSGGLWGTISGMSNPEKIVAGAGATAAAAVVTGLLIVGGPPGWITLVLAGTLLGYGMLVTGFENETANEIQVLPVCRWSRPWVGGLQGYRITDFWGNLGASFDAWQSDTIFPLIELYRVAKGSSNAVNPLPIQGQVPNPIGQ